MDSLKLIDTWTLFKVVREKQTDQVVTDNVTQTLCDNCKQSSGSYSSDILKQRWLSKCSCHSEDERSTDQLLSNVDHANSHSHLTSMNYKFIVRMRSRSKDSEIPIGSEGGSTS